MKKSQIFETKIRNITGLVSKTNFNTKFTKIENKIPDAYDFVEEKFRHKTINCCSKFRN